MDSMTNDAKKKKMETMFKLGIGAAGVMLVAPATFIILKGILGLAALAVAGAAGFTVVQLAPVFSTKIANWRMKLLIAEVEENPIETMINLQAEKQEELFRADNNIMEFETEIGNFDDQIDDFKSQYPNESETYQTLSEKMHEALIEMKTEQTQARAELHNFELQVKKAKAIYKMSCAAQKVTQLSKSAEAQVFAKIRQDVAFDAVRTQLNRSFASLNLALERRKDSSLIMLGNKTVEPVAISNKKEE